MSARTPGWFRWLSGGESNPTWSSWPATADLASTGPLDSSREDDAFFAALRAGLRGDDPPASRPDDPPASRPDDPPGPWPDLGLYRVLGRVGRGGFGQVLRAFDPVLDREVALKVPRPDTLATPELRERFRREAQTAARLDHPNVVPVYDYKVQGNVCFIVTALVDGPNLQAWLRERADQPVPADLAARLLAPLAAAVQHAHDRGILHADIKPANVLVSPPAAGPGDPVPRLTDFGLARALSPEGDASRGGLMHGTPPYMAPEQVLGRRNALTARIDVYALGATLYQVLTGRPPFGGETRGEVLWQVVNSDPVAPRALRPGLPRDIETITLKCLEKDPRRRYATAGALASDLTQFLNGQPIAARPPAPHEQLRHWARRRPGVAAALALTLLGLASLGVVLQVRNRYLEASKKAVEQKQREILALLEQNAEQTRRAREAADKAQTLVTQNARHYRNGHLRLVREDLDAGAFERAQTHLLEVVRLDPEGLGDEPGFAWRWLDRHARRHLDLLPAQERGILRLAVSGDGRQALAIDGVGGNRLWSLDAPWPVWTAIQPGRALQQPDFSPDGRLIAAWEVGPAPGLERVAALVVLDAPTGAELGRFPPPTRADRALREDWLVSLRWLGPRTLAATWHMSANRFGLTVYDLSDPARPAELHCDPGLTFADCPGPPGSALYGATHGSTVGVYEAATGRPVREWPGLAHLSRAVAMDPEARAVLIDIRDQDGVFVAFDLADGHEIGRVPIPDGWKGRVLLADRGRLAVWCDGDLGRIVLADLPTGRTRTLPLDDADLRRTPDLAIDPGATKLIAVSDHPGGGGGPVGVWELPSGRRLANPPMRPALYRTPHLAPDGRSALAFLGRSLQRWHLDAPDPDTLNQPVGHTDEAWALAFRPDGRQLASGADDTDDPQMVRIWDVDTGRQLRGWSAGEGTITDLAYAPDGKTLATTHLADRDNVRIWDAETGARKATLPAHKAAARSVAYSPDGKVLATAGDDWRIHLWDATTGARLATITDHTDKVRSLAFGPHGQSLASGSNDQTVRLWDLRTPSAPRRSHVWTVSEDVAAVTFDSQGGRVIAADQGGTIHAWETDSGTFNRSFAGADVVLRSLSASPDGSTLAVADLSGQVVLWDLPTAEVLLTLEGHDAQVNSVRFSPDGNVLASCDHHGRVRLWRGRQPTDPPLELRLPPSSPANPRHP